MDRYQRQILLPQIGDQGQAELRSSWVLLIGCGALGCVIAEQLVRAGIGLLNICDRDIVELNNLQRQTLFDERDAAVALPKAIAARRRLKQINPTVAIEANVIDVHAENIESLFDDADVVFDGTDNAETRYLINDTAIKMNTPWIYGACVGTTGRAMGIVPNRTPCLRCLFPDPPATGELPTCDTAGVLAPAAAVVASLQVTEAMKILLEDKDAGANLISFDLWPLRFREISTVGGRDPDCPTCGLHRYDFLTARGCNVVTLCGRNTVQVRPLSNCAMIDMNAIASRLPNSAKTEFFLRAAFPERGLTLTLFADGRALIHGTSDPALARSIYAKFVGS